MTENEAIEKLKNMRLYMQITDKNNDCKFTEDDYKAKGKEFDGFRVNINDLMK